MLKPEVMINFGVLMVERLTETYGGIFSRLVRNAVVEFVSKEVGEEAPRVENLQEAADYVRSRLERYPSGHCAFSYGIGKAESILQGAAGPASRLFLRDIVMRLTELDDMKGIAGEDNDTTSALKAFRKLATSMELIDGNSISFSGDAESSELQITKCPNGDSCGKMISEGIIAAGSRKPICTFSLGSAVTAEALTKIPHDYEMTVLKPPNCVARIFRP